MKTGILTFHASHNYGSMLQAYALQTTIQKMGHECEIINLRTDVQKGLIPPEIIWRHPRATLSKVLKHPERTFLLQKKYNRFEKFLNHDLCCSKELHNTDEVSNYISEANFDAIIVGSDQIWNVDCWDFDRSYVLDFNQDFRRIAYAPSLGSHPEKMSETNTELLKKCWKRFDYLSTREIRGSEYVEKLIGKECATVLDPTLLLSESDYYQLCNDEPIIKTPYLFYYTPREEEGTFAFALRYAQLYNLKIVVSQSHQEYIGNNIIRKLDCGPREFLNIVRHSVINIGNSFHLLAFSLIFHKEFIMLSKEEDSRMLNILRPLGLEDRLMKPSCKRQSSFSLIDYTTIITKMVKLRISSFKFLSEALN